MKGKHTEQHSTKLSLLLIKFAVCYGLFASPYALAASPTRPPQGAQLLPQDPSVRIQTFPNTNELQIEQLQPTVSTSTATLYVRRIKICGNTVFNTDTLHTLVADGEGKTLNLNQLNQLAALFPIISSNRVISILVLIFLLNLLKMG